MEHEMTYGKALEVLNDVCLNGDYSAKELQNARYHAIAALEWTMQKERAEQAAKDADASKETTLDDISKWCDFILNFSTSPTELRVANAITRFMVQQGENASTCDCTRDEIKINMALHKIGIAPHLRGHQDIVDAVEILHINKNAALTKYIYVETGKKNGQPWKNVERDIRNAIAYAWKRNQSRFIHDYFSEVINPITGRPSAGAFLHKLEQLIWDIGDGWE